MMTHQRTTSGLNGVAPPRSLTPAQFHILLTLAEGQRHGFGIMQEIERRTDSAIELGPGTLYRSIKQLLARGLIVEVDRKPDTGSQRRIYALTPQGRVSAVEETQRLSALARWAEEAMAPEGGRR
jgi:DNA-binding PadR family transcriptional regulator